MLIYNLSSTPFKYVYVKIFVCFLAGTVTVMQPRTQAIPSQQIRVVTQPGGTHVVRPLVTTAVIIQILFVFVINFVFKR